MILPRMSDKGFTCAELMIVTAIMGLVAVIAAPSVSTVLARNRVRGAAKKIAWDLRVARVQAIRLDQNVIVDFLNDHEYAIGADTNNNGSLDAGEGMTTNIQDSYHNATFSATNDLIFNPRGSTNNTLTLTVSNVSNSQQVAVSFTGMVKIH